MTTPLGSQASYPVGCRFICERTRGLFVVVVAGEASEPGSEVGQVRWSDASPE
jgi:hypothetical protein